MNNPDPDLYTSWDEFAKQLFWDFQMGEAFVLATARYSNGYPARFHVVAPWLVNVEIGGDGLRRYTIGKPSTSPAATCCTSATGHHRRRPRARPARGRGRPAGRRRTPWPGTPPSWRRPVGSRTRC